MISARPSVSVDRPQGPDVTGFWTDAQRMRPAARGRARRERMGRLGQSGLFRPGLGRFRLAGPDRHVAGRPSSRRRSSGSPMQVRVPRALQNLPEFTTWRAVLHERQRQNIRRKVTCLVRDPGIGVFHSIATTLHLPDEEAALIELMKGQATRQPEARTGEGILFTSRMVDRLALRAHRLQLERDSAEVDVFVSTRRHLAGTEVRVEVQRATRRRLEEVLRARCTRRVRFPVSQDQGARHTATPGPCVPHRGPATFRELAIP